MPGAGRRTCRFVGSVRISLLCLRLCCGRVHECLPMLQDRRRPCSWTRAPLPGSAASSRCRRHVRRHAHDHPPPNPSLPQDRSRLNPGLHHAHDLGLRPSPSLPGRLPALARRFHGHPQAPRCRLRLRRRPHGTSGCATSTPSPDSPPPLSVRAAAAAPKASPSCCPRASGTGCS